MRKINEVQNLLNGFSIELNPKVQKKISKINLNKNNKVFITYLPDASEEDVLNASEFVDQQGLISVTHLPSRTMKDLKHVESFLSKLRKKTSSQDILVIGGGGEQNGIINSSIEILESGLLEKFDFINVGVAGHPEGSPDISNEMLDDFIKKKQEIYSNSNLNMEIVTQFFFQIDLFKNWVEELAFKNINMPIRVGYPGPATFKTLLNFGIMSGVGQSLNFFKKNASKVSDLMTKTSNDDLLFDLASLKSSTASKQPSSFHCFPFGGFEKTCNWLNQIQNGDFTIEGEKIHTRDKIF